MAAYAMRQRARADNLTVCYHKKQIDVSFLCACPVIVNEFRHSIVKVFFGSTRPSPRVPTATLTMLRRNTLSITEQAHAKLMLICGGSVEHNELMLKPPTCMFLMYRLYLFLKVAM